MPQHASLSLERWSSFSIDQQILMIANEIERALDLRIVEAEIFVAEQFQNTRSDVGAFGVEHRVVVGKGNFVENALGAIFVE